MQSRYKILLTQGALLILVKILKHPLPVINVVEQLPELVDIDGAGPVGVEHVDHQATRLLAEHRHVPVSQGLAELYGVNMATIILEKWNS